MASTTPATCFSNPVTHALWNHRNKVLAATFAAATITTVALLIIYLVSKTQAGNLQGEASAYQEGMTSVDQARIDIWNSRIDFQNNPQMLDMLDKVEKQLIDRYAFLEQKFLDCQSGYATANELAEKMRWSLILTGSVGGITLLALLTSLAYKRYSTGKFF